MTQTERSTLDQLTGKLGGTMAGYWWLLLLRGLIALAFGVLLITRPGISLATLILLFGAFSLADGAITAWSAVKHRKQRDNWVLMLIAGLAGIAIGVITFTAPGITAMVLLFYIAIWSIVTGVIQIVMAVRLRAEIEGEFWLGLAGLVSVLFGVFLIAKPGAGILSVLWILAAYAILFGVLLVALSFRVRRLAKA